MKFYPETHEYIHKQESYPSITKIIDAFFGKFNKYNVAAAYAKKHNLKKSKVLKDWANKGKKATTIGTLIHEYAEMQISKPKSPYMKKTTREKEIIRNNKTEIKNLKLKTKSIIRTIKNKYLNYDFYTESILYSELLKIAGSADLILIKKEEDSEDINNHNIDNNNKPNTIIIDHKTSKTISKIPFKEHWPKSYTHPVCLPNANFFKYSLQLNMYELLYKITQNQKYPLKYENIDFSSIIVPPYLNFGNVFYERPFPFPLSDNLFISHIPSETLIPCMKIPEIITMYVLISSNPLSRKNKGLNKNYFYKYNDNIKITG